MIDLAPSKNNRKKIIIIAGLLVTLVGIQEFYGQSLGLIHRGHRAMTFGHGVRLG